MMTYTLLIENKSNAYDIIQKYNFKMIEYYPHFEIEFFTENFEEFFSTYRELTGELKSNDIEFVSVDHLSIPQP